MIFFLEEIIEEIEQSIHEHENEQKDAIENA